MQKLISLILKNYIFLKNRINFLFKNNPLLYFYDIRAFELQPALSGIFISKPWVKLYSYIDKQIHLKVFSCDRDDLLGCSFLSLEINSLAFKRKMFFSLCRFILGDLQKEKKNTFWSSFISVLVNSFDLTKKAFSII